MRHFAFILLFLMVLSGAHAQKRQFRGAWIQTVNGQFSGMSRDAMQKNLTHQLDVLQQDGVNAIIFQVRPECDALYESKLEPWSRYLTGRQGEAPNPYWDPLAWMVEQCHKRGMEIHAWLNPYRAKTASTKALAPNHIASTRPQSCFPYAGQLILNPALKENRDFICRVTDDIVSRYDIDGLHIDDYFYPYPSVGEEIPDRAYFQADPRGFKNIGDWRRDNVNIFIKQLGETIHNRKPWVKFGVSPFGIYRNQRSDPKNGSATNGLQNYDDLYADVLLWVNNGWIDYCVPQLYWEIGNKAADYETLLKWWDKFASNRPLFIGESVDRTVKFTDVNNASINQMPAKYQMHQNAKHTNGIVLWYSKAVVDNIGNYGDMLRNTYWRYPALQPLMPFIDSHAPKKPRKLMVVNVNGERMLFWTAPKGKAWNDVAAKYVVYRFNTDELINLNDPSKIVTVTYDNFCKLPYIEGKTKAVYVVTALDRMSNESKGKKKKIKL